MMRRTFCARRALVCALPARDGLGGDTADADHRGDRQERPEGCPSHPGRSVTQTTKKLMPEHSCLQVFRGAIVWARLRRSISHRCWPGRRPPRHSRSPPAAASASEPPTVPPWPGIPPHKPRLSSAVKFTREPGLAPMSTAALADRHRNQQGPKLPDQGGPGGLAPCFELCSGVARPFRPQTR